MPTDRFESGAVVALTFLLELVARSAGYQVHGVRGWATASRIESGAGCWAATELMRDLAYRGFVLQEDVRAPGGRAPRWVYRVSQPGIDYLAGIVGVWAAGIRDPRERTERHVLLGEGVAIALVGLRAASRPSRPAGSQTGNGHIPWLSLGEITNLLVRHNTEGDGSPRWFLSEDMRWLVQRGIAQERVMNGKRRYRIAAGSIDLHPLVWRAPGG